MGAPHIIGFIGFDGVEALDLVGPMEAFCAAAAGTQPLRYECLVLGLTRRPFKSESGLVLTPRCSLDEVGHLDTLIIPGGSGLRDGAVNRRVVEWVQSVSDRIGRIGSICTGIYGLAPTGLLDGRRVTTHWKFACDVAARFPSLQVEPDRLFIWDQKFFTGAGITAGIDLALALIEADHGAKLAISVARQLVVYLKRSGGQSQYSEPLQLQVRSVDGLDAVVTWIAERLSKPISVGLLASQAHLSSRQLHRRCLSAYGVTPRGLIELLRLDLARDQLRESGPTIGRIAHAVGYRSADAFTRAFSRRFGITPVEYRIRFPTAERTTMIRSPPPLVRHDP